MLTVQTNVQSSPIAGSGLFAAELIKKGAIVWMFHPSTTDRFVSKADFLNRYPEGFDFGYRKDDIWFYNKDDAKYMNHSDVANTAYEHGIASGICIAVRDIQAGEELTANYREFDDDFPLYAHEYT